MRTAKAGKKPQTRVSRAKAGEKAEHRESTRDALIAAALERVRKFGATHFSLREVARDAGLSCMAPYRHFKSKEDLIAAIAEVGHLRLCEVFQQVERHVLDPAERFRAMGVGYVNFAKKNPELYKFMFGSSMPNPKDYPTLERACDECFGYLERAIAYCQHHGYMKNKPIDAFAMLVWSTIHGFSMLLIEGVFENSINDSGEKALLDLNNYIASYFLE